MTGAGALALEGAGRGRPPASDPGVQRGGARPAPDPAVHLGADGWLFLIGGTNRVAVQYEAGPGGWWRLARWSRLVAARARRAARAGIAYRHLVVPEKLAIYDHRLGGLALDARRSPARRFRTLCRWSPAASRALLDLVGPLRAERDAADLYLRTDSHWTHEGCAVAYRALCRSLGAAPRDLSDRPVTAYDFLGDLGRKLDPPPAPEPVRRRAVLRDAVRTYASPVVERFEAVGRADALHVGAHVVYRNEHPDADPRRVVLFGDSYANFVTSVPSGLLTTMLAETFRELHFVWSASVDWTYVARVVPDILLTEISERFMARVPVDGRPVDAPHPGDPR